MSNASNNPHRKTKHHLIPKVRLTPDDRKRLGTINIAKKTRREQEAWHYIFGRLTPFEAVLLVIMRLAPEGYFQQASVVVKWKAYFQKLQKAHYHRFKLSDEVDRKTIHLIDSSVPKIGEFYNQSLELLFGEVEWCSVIRVICDEWSPRGYFHFIKVCATGNDGTQLEFKYNPQPKKRVPRKKEPKKQKHRPKKDRQT